MFLLLSLGFIIGGSFFLSEWLGGCINFCKARRRRSILSIESNPRSHDAPTPRDKLNSVQYNNLSLEKIHDNEHELNDIHSRNFSVDVEMNNHEFKRNSVINCDETSDTFDQLENELQTDDSADQTQNKSDEDVNCIMDEIDKMFNFDEVFGDNNNENIQSVNEEIESS